MLEAVLEDQSCLARISHEPEALAPLEKSGLVPWLVNTVKYRLWGGTPKTPSGLTVLWRKWANAEFQHRSDALFSSSGWREDAGRAR